jgi:hypothetical protein
MTRFQPAAVDGLQRGRTRLAIASVRMAWRRGNLPGVGRGLRNSARRVVEGGVRWQAARYLLSLSAQLRSEGRLAEALTTCWAATEALGRYDNNDEVYGECEDLDWEEKGY